MNCLIVIWWIDDFNKSDCYSTGIRTAYELKPMNPRGVRSGIRQLQKYNKALGGGYKLRLELY